MFSVVTVLELVAVQSRLRLREWLPPVRYKVESAMEVRDYDNILRNSIWVRPT